MNKDTDVFYKRIQAEAKRMTDVIDRHREEYLALKEFIATSGRPFADGGISTDIGCMQGEISGLIVQWHLGEEETFKAGALVIEWLMGRGWTEGQSCEDAEWGFRQVSLAMPSDGYTLRATVRMWPHARSRYCRKVEAGTKPMYKFVCEEES